MFFLKDSRLIPIEQGTQEWLALRKLYITATEIAMITNRACWETFEKMKLSTKSFQNKAMKRGNELEPQARVSLSRETGISYFPAVFVCDSVKLMASLDGLAIGRKATCEIKCPEKGIYSDLWKDALAGKIPSRYWKQMQQGLLLSNAPVCHYWVYDEVTDSGIKIDVYPDIEYQKEILTSAKDYWAKKESGVAIIKPAVEVDHDLAKQLAKKYEEVMKDYGELEKLKKRLEERLNDFVPNDCERAIIGNVQIDKKEVSGSIDYKAIVSECLPHINVETYRKEPSKKHRTTIKLMKNMSNEDDYYKKTHTG